MRKQPKITPGPWAWDGPADNIHITQAENPDNRICFLTSNGPTIGNANMLAAAPELYESAMSLLQYIADCMIVEPETELANRVAAARAALAKAEGRS